MVHAAELFPQIEFEEYGDVKINNDFIFELPIEFGGTLTAQTTLQHKDMMAFDITTGAAEAQRMFDEK